MVSIAASTWGTWSLFLRPAGVSTLVSSPILFLVMGLVSLPAALRGPRSTWDRATVGLLVANAAFDGLNVIAFFGAMTRTTVAIAVLTHYAAPILIALIAPRVDGVTTPGARPAAAVALLGLAIILEPWHAPADGAITGALLGLASAVCYCGNVFTVRRIAARIGPARQQCYHSLIAGVAMAPMLLGRAGELTGTGLALLVAGATTIGAAAGILFSLGLLRIGSARTAVLTFCEPVVAVTVGALVWGEPLHPLAALGGALVLGAGILVARKAR